MFPLLPGALPSGSRAPLRAEGRNKPRPRPPPRQSAPWIRLGPRPRSTRRLPSHWAESFSPHTSCKAAQATVLLPHRQGSQAQAGELQAARDSSFPGGTRRGGAGAPSPAPLSTARPSQKGPRQRARPRTTPPSAPSSPLRGTGARHSPGLGLDREGVAPVLLLQADQHIVEVLVELQEGRQAGWVGATEQPPLSLVTSLLLFLPTSPAPVPLPQPGASSSLPITGGREPAHLSQKTHRKKGGGSGLPCEQLLFLGPPFSSSYLQAFPKMPHRACTAFNFFQLVLQINC